MKFKAKSREVQHAEGTELETTVVKINRCATVVKGGRRFSFSALVVVGNRAGAVGFGFGKANEVPPAVDKAEKDARKHLYRISLRGDTIPHKVVGRFGASKVLLLPASAGTGVIAGAAVRGVVDLVGIKNILTKSFGSNNPVNLVKATLQGLLQLRTLEETEALRGVPLRGGKKAASPEPAEAAKTGGAESKASIPPRQGEKRTEP
jgi:small subunit ribosomal protein S5